MIAGPPRPQFLSKAEREKIKAEREQKITENLKKKENEIDKKRRDYLDFEKKIFSRSPPQPTDSDTSIEFPKDELNQIKDYYLGTTKDTKKILKPSEKFRNVFHFDWDESDDTTKSDVNPLYLKRHEPKLLHGRGFRAGQDPDREDSQNKRHGRDEESELNSKKRHIHKHWSSKTLEEMTDRDWMIYREDFDIHVKGTKVPPPIRSWDESKLPKEILKAIKTAGFSKPTPIQMQTIPVALELRDIIGIAETGSGKTAAFVIPMLVYVTSLPLLNDETGQDGPYSLILAPSRELAIQIDDETKKFALYTKCRAIAIIGGRSVETQAFDLRKGVEIIIGTPGRVKDCLDRSYTVLNQCNYVILDEADRMIDMGFEETVNDILDRIPTTSLKEGDDSMIEEELRGKAGHRRHRITQMFSATMSIDRLMKKYLRSPTFISIGDIGIGKKSIEQILEFVTEGKKKNALQSILETASPPIIIFVNLKKQTDAIVKMLSEANFSAVSLHGGKSQENRELAMETFKAGKVDILVATDVAGRGIDVEGVNTVINYDMPKQIEAYVHRIGRTGRAGKNGIAISLVTEEDSDIFYDLKQQLISSGNSVPTQLSQHPASKQKGPEILSFPKDKPK